MNTVQRHFAFVVGVTGTRFYKDIEDRGSRVFSIQESVRQEAQRIVGSDMKMTTPRKNPQAVLVKVHEQKITNGVLVETFFADHSIRPPLEPMMPAEYDAEIRNILSRLPQEFHGFVKRQVEDRDVSYEEKVDIAREIVDGLVTAVADYRRTEDK